MGWVQSQYRVLKLDDLIDLSKSTEGLVIFVDGCDVFLEKDEKLFFDLIEAFMVQLHHWLKAEKPCHLCFQMREDVKFGSHFK